VSHTPTPEMIAALRADRVNLFLLYEGVFASGSVRLWTGAGFLDWDGRLWTGLGQLLSVSAITETDEVAAGGTAITLSGVPLATIEAAIAEARQGLPGRIWLGLMTDAGEIIPDPLRLFSGRLDVPEIREDEATATVTLSYESRLIDLTRPREWRYTHESQQALFPGDRGLEFVTAIQEKEITWGRG